MSPSFDSGDLLIVNLSAYRDSNPQRGDVVIVTDPRQGIGVRRSLKRLIALPGERIRLADGMLWIDETHVIEPYLHGRPSTLGLEESVWELKRDEYFVMGDNRLRSTDSRSYGAVSLDSIEGRAAARIWPINRACKIRNGV